MAKDDYLKLRYIILRNLYEFKKQGVNADLDAFSAETLNINKAYWDTIIEELLEEGYVKGFKVKQYISGKALSRLENIDITPKGIEYLSENSTMQKIAKALANVKDWVGFVL